MTQMSRVRILHHLHLHTHTTPHSTHTPHSHHVPWTIINDGSWAQHDVHSSLFFHFTTYLRWCCFGLTAHRIHCDKWVAKNYDDKCFLIVLNFQFNTETHHYLSFHLTRWIQHTEYEFKTIFHQKAWHIFSSAYIRYWLACDAAHRCHEYRTKECFNVYVLYSMAWQRWIDDRIWWMLQYWAWHNRAWNRQWNKEKQKLAKQKPRNNNKKQRNTVGRTQMK